MLSNKINLHIGEHTVHVCISLCLSRRAAPSAEFSVDRTRHLMSFLSMLGPSPDWNVGLSAEDLCTKECGWIQRLDQDLIPWDAGTDSGVTYEVRVLGPPDKGSIFNKWLWFLGLVQLTSKIPLPF